MKHPRTFLPLLILILSMQAGSGEQDRRAALRRDPVSVEQQVAGLLGRMTLEEKVAQMLCLWPALNVTAPFSGKRLIDADGNFNRETAGEVLRHGIGQVARPSENKSPRQNVEYTNAIQKYLVENTRLGIPAIFHEEGLHGHMAPGGTSFPQAIALAGTWDVDLVERVFSAVAREMRARGGHQALSPVLDLARDARWGRFEETYGEDPYLASRMGVAAVRGFQGRGPLVDDQHVIATLKHFAAHGQPESGTNAGPGNYSEREIRETFLRPFEAAVREAGAVSVMASYNEVDGIPSHANGWLLNDVLRGEWGFQGYIVADYFGINQLESLHHVAADQAGAGRQALEAGIDIELPEPSGFETLVRQVREGRVSQAAVDRAVARLLRAKFLLGLFDDPYRDPDYAERITNSTAHRALALEAARKAVVLLKNDRGALPLERSELQRLAVIGPNADRCLIGGYSDDPGRCITVLEGIRRAAGDTIEVVYEEGVRITKEGANWWTDRVELADPEANRRGIARAARAAAGADRVVLVIGGNEVTSREAWAPSHLGDRDRLDLVGQQDELVDAVLRTGTPAVAVLFNGRPLSIVSVAEKVPAILEAWYLGQEGGTAVAELLFGEVNPAGRLPVTFPRSVGQVPVFYNHKPSARRGYLFADATPLFAFGHGLSYTEFQYADLRVSPEQIGNRGSTEVSVRVTNTGDRAGDEVVQLYVRDRVSSVTRPVLELRGFERIHLQAGESKIVQFELGPEHLSLWNRDMQRVVEPGEFDIMAGGSSTQLIRVLLRVVE